MYLMNMRREHKKYIIFNKYLMVVVFLLGFLMSYSMFVTRFIVLEPASYDKNIVKININYYNSQFLGSFYELFSLSTVFNTYLVYVNFNGVNRSNINETKEISFKGKNFIINEGEDLFVGFVNSHERFSIDTPHNDGKGGLYFYVKPQSSQVILRVITFELALLVLFILLRKFEDILRE